jgi:hypothetical protein
VIARQRWQLKQLQQHHHLSDTSFHINNRNTLQKGASYQTASTGLDDSVDAAETSDEPAAVTLPRPRLQVNASMSNRASMGGSSTTRFIDSTSYTEARNSSAQSQTQPNHTSTVNQGTFDSEPSSHVRPSSLASVC